VVARHARGALTAFACAAAWGCTRLTEDALPPGSRFPVAARSTARAQIVWVMRPADYLTCQTAANGIREFQRGAGAGVPLTVLYVGPHAPWLSEFLARQRITATVVTIEEDAFRRAFHRTPDTWLYLLSHGVVRSVLPGRGYVRPARRWAPLVHTVNLRQPGPVRPAAGAAVHPFQGARP
jgi:hypothetical protein